MKLDRWLASIPELRGRPVAVEPLRGGLSNRSFLLTGSFGRWVLRLNAAVPGVDRAREHAVLRRIAGRPWAPEIVRNAPVEGYLLYAYRDGPTWTRERARATTGQGAVGRWLRSLHALPVAGIAAVDLAAAFEGYLAALPAVAAGSIADAGRARLGAWEAGAGAMPPVLCHLDLVAGNLLGADRLEAVIDWEFAAAAEPALDLAFFLHYQGLDAESGAACLDGYGADEALRGRVREGLAVAELLDRAWRLIDAPRDVAD